jgi:DNA-directed RNA polymerase beta subunit
MLIEVGRDRDSSGDLEEFTWDLFPVVPADLTTHLDADGLPKIGTEIKPGMIVVGKIGKSSTFDPGCQPMLGEANWLSFEEMRDKYGHQWRNTSFYATPETVGTVTEAYLTGDGESQRAVVVLTGGASERSDAFGRDTALARGHHS